MPPRSTPRTLLLQVTATDSIIAIVSLQVLRLLHLLIPFALKCNHFLYYFLCLCFGYCFVFHDRWIGGCRTSARWSTLFPEWREELRLSLPLREVTQQTLLIRVKDTSKLGESEDELIGQVIPLRSYLLFQLCIYSCTTLPFCHFIDLILSFYSSL